MLNQYVPLLWLFGLAGVVVGAIMLLTTILGPKKDTATKAAPFECGSGTIGSTRTRFSVKFYLVAITFIVFDVEAVFVIPWAVIYKDYFINNGAGLLGLGAMLMFLVVLTLGLAYEWRSGGLEWD